VAAAAGTSDDAPASRSLIGPGWKFQSCNNLLLPNAEKNIQATLNNDHAIGLFDIFAN
jgi:hypothetical protein